MHLIQYYIDNGKLWFEIVRSKISNILYQHHIIIFVGKYSDLSRKHLQEHFIHLNNLQLREIDCF